MNYEKAYKDALQLARSYYGKGTNEFLDTIFPELTESEDERIIGWLIGIVNGCKELSFEDKVKLTRYLEKQKDANKEYWRGYREGKQEILDKYAEIEKQKEQKPVEASGTAEPDYGICDDYIPASLHHALKRHGWYAGHVGEEEEFVLQRRKYVERNWPADKNNLTQEQKEQKTDGKAMLHVAEKSYQIGLRDGKMEQKPNKCNGCNNVKGCITCVNGDQWAHIEEQKPVEWKPQPESLEALMYAIEGKWDMILPTSYLSRRLEDLYEGLVNTYDIEAPRELKCKIDDPTD